MHFFSTYKFLLVVLLSTFCFAKDESHRKVIFQLTDSLIHTTAADNNHLSATVVSLKLNDQLQNNFVMQQIIHSFVSKKKEVSLNRQPSDTVWECGVREMSIVYGEVFSETFFGSRKVERNITLSMDVTITALSTGTILYSKNIFRSAIDTISYSLVSQLNDGSIPFTMSTQPQLSFIDTIIEPAIITVASGVVIYLFFTIRS